MVYTGSNLYGTVYPTLSGPMRAVLFPDLISMVTGFEQKNNKPHKKNSNINKSYTPRTNTLVDQSDK